MTFSDLYPNGTAAIPFRTRPAKRVRGDVEGVVHGTKSSPIYLVHSYPTKVPPEAIEPFIECFTRPGDVVCDPFAGSGMTGVAARRLGRHAMLSDLSPLAIHLGTNLNVYCDPAALDDASRAVLADVREALEEWYAGRCSRCGSDARLDWLLWGDTVACTSCGAPIRLWDAGFDHASGVMTGPHITCPRCSTRVQRRGARLVEVAPVWASVTCLHGCGRFGRPSSHDDAERAGQIALETIADWVPDVRISADREMYIRSALELHQVHSVADFYTPRNLRALARMWAAIQAWPDLRVRQALTLAFTNTAWHGTRMRRFNARGGQRPLTGTLYIPQMSVEVNVANVFRNKIRQLIRFFASESWSQETTVDVRLGTATDLSHIASGTVDYVFTDPPFGGNIFYADCALIAESWLGSLTDVREEAVVNHSLKPVAGGKSLSDYQGLMTSAFSEVARILKPNSTATVVFQNTDAAVWQALEASLETAGLNCSRATTLDKSQHSHKGYKGRSGAEDVAGFDMILTLRHSKRRRQPQPLTHDRNDALSLLTKHLAALPQAGESATTDRQRTLPYLHALLLQAHFNGSIGLQEQGYAAVREICSRAFRVDESGFWHVRDTCEAGPERGADTLVGVARVKGMNDARTEEASTARTDLDGT